MSLLIPPWPAPVAVAVQKAVTGAGATALTYQPHVTLLQNTPQRKALAAATLYHDNDGVRIAESAVSTRGGALEYNGDTGERPGWHLIDANGEPVIDDSAPDLLAVRDLLLNPQGAVPEEERQPGIDDFTSLLTQTLRYMGLCGQTWWYLDGTEALGGTPAAIFHLAPWRLFEVLDRNTKRLIGWTLDKPLEEGGIPLERRNLVPFYLQPPDTGHWTPGIVQAAWMKAALVTGIDRHIANVLGAGGRLTGLLSPKIGSVVSPDQWDAFIRDWRQITSDPAAAQRLQIVQSPVDFTQTAATPREMSLVELDERTLNWLLATWGVPRSQVGLSTPAGLNSGDTKSYDEAILWQGAIGPRIRRVQRTMQTKLLDRYQALGIELTIALESPAFDDDAPLYAKAVQAVSIPLTVAERREIVGREPFGDAVVDDLGRVVDRIVMLPTGQSEAFYADVLPPMVIEQATIQREAAQQIAAASPPPQLTAGKAKFLPEVPTLRRKVLHVLGQQREMVTDYLRRVGLDHLRRKADVNWNAERENKRLIDALYAPLRILAKQTANRIHAERRKATRIDEFAEDVARRVLTRGAGRVVGINATTRDRIREAVSEAVQSAPTIDDVIRAVEDLDIFNELRAETIARTEAMFAHNAATLGSYQDLDVTHVEAIDGDEDEECAARNGQTFTIEEAEGIEDHPNGTLDWVPVIPEETEEVEEEPEGKAIIPMPRQELAAIMGMADYIKALENRPEPPAPIINIEPVIVPAPMVTMDTSQIAYALLELRESQQALIAEMQRPRVRTPVRDERGKIVRVEET